MPQLVSLQVGQPQLLRSDLADGEDALWTSSIFKRAAAETLFLSRTSLEGDAQADLRHHGGPDKAVCCYAAEHYEFWRETLGLDEKSFPFGAFGENFTVLGLIEEAACIGDIYTVGGARVQISQPRMPCFKLGRRWGFPDLPNAVKNSGRTGCYLRVLEPGAVSPQSEMLLIERPMAAWPVARVNDAMYLRKDDEALARELGHLPLLAEAWRSPFRRRAGLIRSRKR